MAGSSGGNKSEKPTPERLRKAREQGQFLTAKGLVGAIQFIAILLLLGNTLPHWKEMIESSMRSLLDRSMSSEIGEAEWPELISSLMTRTLLPLLSAGGILFLISAGTHLSITKMGFSLSRFTPKADRFNPLTRLKQLPGQNMAAVVEAAILLAVLSMTIQSFLQANAATLMRLPLQSVPVGVAQVAGSLESLLWKAAGIFVLFGAVDMFRQYRKHMSGLKMSKQDIKEEHKRTEGDPQMKARIRRLRRDVLRRQMMREVPKATAIIVNPTHFAVAIRYDMATMPCPVVVAKGKNWLALKIREIATAHNVPIIENPPLARALYDAIDVGRAVPPEFYKAIAEILAYIYRLMGRKLPV